MLKTLEWTDTGVRFIDQTKLPTEEIYVNCADFAAVAEAIRTKIVRGAPAIGVAAAMGIDLRGEVDPVAVVKPGGGRNAKPSMLQDVEAGRSVEVDSILGQIVAFGRDVGVPTPKAEVVLPLLRGLDAWLREGGR